MILAVLGWLAATGLLALAVSSAWHGLRERSRGPWVAAGMYGCGAVILLAVDGILKPLTAGVLACLALTAAAGLLLAGGRDGAGRAALGHAGAGAGYLGADVRGLWRRVLAMFGGDVSRESSGGTAEAAVAEAAASRLIPPVREDPALGVPPEPSVIASAAPVPAPHAALAQYIAGFEPETDMDLKMFMQGHAAGALAIADAWHHFADTCLNGAGLDPAFVGGVLEIGDSEVESAALKAQVHKRFGVIYAQVQEWIAAGRMLPHKAREFLTGEM